MRWKGVPFEDKCHQLGVHWASLQSPFLSSPFCWPTPFWLACLIQQNVPIMGIRLSLRLVFTWRSRRKGSWDFLQPPAVLGLALKVLVVQSCPTVCDPMDCIPPDFSVHRILQARMLAWVAISFSRGSSWPRDRTQVSCIVGRLFTVWATWGLALVLCKLYFSTFASRRQARRAGGQKPSSLPGPQGSNCSGPGRGPFAILLSSASASNLPTVQRMSLGGRGHPRPPLPKGAVPAFLPRIFGLPLASQPIETSSH